MEESEKPCESFQNSVSRFRASLTEKQRQDFRVCSLQDVTAAIRDIENHLITQRQQRNMRRIQKFLEGMAQLSQVIEVFLNVDSTVAFVWAPIKFVLLAAGTWVDTLDQLLDTYAQIGEVLPSLTEYERLLTKHPRIRVHLENYYCDVLEFHRKALDVFARPYWKKVFHSSWRTFTTSFEPTLKRLARHRDLLSDEKITATISEVQGMSESMEGHFQELSRGMEKLHLDVDEEKARQQQERRHKQRDFVFSKLGAPDYQDDFERASRERSKIPSGDWIKSDDMYKQWVDVTTVGNRALYLHGIPGAGKTILASRIIEHLNEIQDKNHEIGLNSTVAYFFFKQSQQDKRTVKVLALSILRQLASQDDVVLDLVYQEYFAVDPRKKRYAPNLLDLAAKAVASQRVCFLVVDGLDECSNDDLYQSHAENQGEIIDWLEAMVSPKDCNDSDTDSGDRCIRLLLSGQRNGFLEERLSLYPQIRLEAVPEHEGDIKSYAEAKVQQLQKDKPGVTEQMRQHILNVVCSTAKGMFLYAKIVLGNLLNQRSLGFVKRELETKNFPKGLHEAYARVVVHILDNPIEGERDAAKQILGYVACAERPLMWKELQSRFCIDVHSNIADPDFRLSKSCKSLCGSFVEVEKNPMSTAPSDDTIFLVHDTALIYLQQEGRLNIAEENANMAVFCSQYLRSAPFSFQFDEPKMRESILSGYYGFVDYAAANWWRHAKRTAASGDGEIQNGPALQTVCNFLESFKGLSAVTSLEAATQTIEITRRRISDLPDDSRHIEAVFPFEDRIRRIRNAIESMLTDDAEAFGHASELYGYLGYKCPKQWCHSFAHGLGTRRKRDNHVNEHERPFRCDVDGCFGEQIGFAKVSDLAKHNIQLHNQAPKIEFPEAPGLADSIIRSAARGDLSGVQECVAAGVNINVASPKNGDSFPLFAAATNGHLEICRYLLDQGAEVDARCKKSGKTALQAAVLNDDASIARLFLDAGANPRLRNKAGKTALSISGSRRGRPLISVFTATDLKHMHCTGSHCLVGDITVPATNKRGVKQQVASLFPLITAIENDDFQNVKDFISNYCGDLNRETGDLDTMLPLHCAIKANRDLITQELLSLDRVDVNTVDCKGAIPLHYACAAANYALVRQLFPITRHVDQPNQNDETPLTLLLNNSSGKDPTPLVSLLIKSGQVDSNRVDVIGRIPLHYACAAANEHLIRLLLPITEYIDTRDKRGSTPLMLLLGSPSQVDSIASLVSLFIDPGGADLNILDNGSRLPLHHACSWPHSPHQVVKLILSGTKEPDHRDNFGMTPFHIAVATKDPSVLVATILLDSESINLLNENAKGETIGMSAAAGATLEILDLIVGREPLALSTQSQRGITPLHSAAYALRADVVQYLLSKGDVDVNLQYHTRLPSWRSCNGPFRSEFLRTPLVLAMESASFAESDLRLVGRSILISIMSTEELNLEHHIAKNEQQFLNYLLLKSCDGSIRADMVKAGISYLAYPPWEDMNYLSDSCIYIRHLPRSLSLTIDDILDALRRFKFIDVAKTNYPLARRILHSTRLKPGLLDFSEAGELLELFATHASAADFQAAVRLGFDPDSTIPEPMEDAFPFMGFLSMLDRRTRM